MAENHDVKDIEADIRRMLNLQNGSNSRDIDACLSSLDQAENRISISRADLESLKASHEKEVKNQKSKSKQKSQTEAKNKEGAGNDKEVNNSAPKDDKEETENQEDVVKKKKRKKKKIKKKIAGNKSADVTGLEESDSDMEEDESTTTVKGNIPSDIGFQPKYLDDKLTPAIERELELQRIYPLKKKSAPFPKALYFCRLCDFHCDSIALSRQHASDARHRRRLEILIQDKKLKNLPTPSVKHYSVLTDILEDIYVEQGLSDSDIKERQSIAESLQDFLQESIPDLKLRVYGSSLTGFGLKQSNLNMNLVLPGGMNPAKGLTQVYRTLNKSDLYKEVRSNFQAKVPSVLFKSPCDRVCCEISIGSEMAYFTSKYLTLYNSRNNKLRKLAVIFRYWAKICELDRQDQGTLPSYCYDLMTVYFLQQLLPQALPVLWKDLSEEVLKRPKTHQDIFDMFETLQKEPWICNNTDSLGMLWRDLLLFYGVKFDIAEIVVCIRSQKLVKRFEKKWKSKRVAIEDPFSSKRNVARSMSNTRLFDYFYNCLRKACLYFSIPSAKIDEFLKTDILDNSAENHRIENSKCDTPGEGECNVSVEESAESVGSGNLDCNNELESEGSCVTGTESDASIKPHEMIERAGESVGEISDLETSTEVFDNAKADRTDTQDGNMSVDLTVDYSEVGSKCSASDECSTDNDPAVDTAECRMCHKIDEDKAREANESSSSALDDTDASNSLAERNESAECEAAGPVSVDKNIPIKHCDQMDFTEVAERIISKIIDSLKTDSRISVQTEKVDDSEDIGKLESVIKDEKSDKQNSEGDECVGKSDSDNETETLDTSPVAGSGQKNGDVCQKVENQYNFIFSRQTLTDGKGPSIFCSICEQEGHQKNNCPEDQLPNLQELPPLTQKHIECLSYVVEKAPKDFSLSKEEMKEREYLRKNLELHLLEEFPDCELRLFGSSKNGFGFHHSDLDICVTFKNKNQQEVNFIECIEAIAKRLKTHRGLYNVFPITTAKVPIVKFKHRNSQLEGDISMYNVLALQNTKLLYTYASIDRRALILGFAIKVFAKVCDIGDASKGSLSSYAYMLLMFHYLQHTKPPVIPVLQELRDENTKEQELMIDGWNAWFYDDLKSIPNIWPHWGQNKQSVGELWLGFFRYYMEEFNIDEQVATIKQFEPLTKFEKLWNGRCLAIEDPFDLNHNLGGGLSRKMNQYILRTFIYARRLYGKPIDSLPSGFETLEDYFFDREQLTEGRPPADRLCRICSKIGHIAKECPRLIAKKEREAAERKRKEAMRQTQDNKNNSQSQQNHSDSRRSMSGRSKSDPGDYGGSQDRQFNSKVYHRQQSERTGQRQIRSEAQVYNRHHQQPSSPQGQGHPLKKKHPQPQSPSAPSPYSNKHQQQQYSYKTGHPSNLFKRANQNESVGSKYGNAAHQMRHAQNIPTKQNSENRNMPNSYRGHPANRNKDYSSSPNHNPSYVFRGPHVEGQRQPQVSVVENSLFSSGVGITNQILISPPIIYPQLNMHNFQYYQVIPPPNIKSTQPGNNTGNPTTMANSIPGGVAPISCPVVVPTPAGTPVFLLAEQPKTGQTKQTQIFRETEQIEKSTYRTDQDHCLK